MEIDDNIFQAIQACWTGKASPEQIELIRDWLDTSQENRDLFERLSKTHYQLAHVQTWKRIDSLQGKEKLNSRLKKQKKSFHWKYLVSGVAAACLILFAVTRFIPHEPSPEKTILDLAQVKSGSPKATLIFDNGKKIQLNADDTFEIKIKNTIVKDGENTGLKYELSDSLSTRATDETVEYNTLVVSRGGEYILTLSDGTKVWLNSETELKYPVRFTGNTREVSVKGEAYFEVTKNRHKPFTVQSDAMRVRVLGTTFNFKSDKNCRVAEATLIEGEIEVKGNKEEGQIILAPGQRAELNKKSGRLTVKQVDAKLDAVWHDNLIPFQKADIFTITKALERFYDVKIILSPDIRADKTYSGVLRRKSTIDSVLTSLQNSIPIDYKIVGSNIFISPK